MAQTPPPPPMYDVTPPSPPKSAVDALMPAWENTKRILFEDFSVRKWLKLALIAFLAGVMGGGGSGGGNFSGGGPGGPGGGGSGGPDFEEFWQQVVAWYHLHSQEIIIGLVALGALWLLLVLLWVYVSSVFRFIFMESVITNNTAIRDSWRRNKAEGVSFFLWRLGFGLVALLIFALFVGLPILLIVMSLSGGAGAGGPNVGAIFGSIGLMFLMIFLILIAAIIIGVINAMTRDFVLPLMYVNRIGVIEGWRRFWEILCGNKLGFLIYFLMKIVVTFAAAIISLFLGCLGLLVGLLPIALIAGIGYMIVGAAGITSWSWSYLWAIIPTAIVCVIGLAYWMTCVLLPVPVYFQSYALKYLGYVQPEAATI